MEKLTTLFARITNAIMAALSKLDEEQLDSYISQGAGEFGLLGCRDRHVYADTETQSEQ